MHVRVVHVSGQLTRRTRWYVYAPELVEVERLTYPSVGEKRPAPDAPAHVPTCLVRAAGNHPDRPVMRVPARDLIMG